MCPQLVPAAQCPSHSSVVGFSPSNSSGLLWGTVVSRRPLSPCRNGLVCAHIMHFMCSFSTITSMFCAFRTDLSVVLPASVFDSCDSLHGALHLFSPRLAGHSLHSCCEARSYTPSYREGGVIGEVFQLSWHNFFFPCVSGPGTLTPVQDFTRHSVRLMDAHLVSQASARLEAREAQVSHIIIHSSSFFLLFVPDLSISLLSRVSQYSSPRLSPFPGLFSLHELPGGGLPCKGTYPEPPLPTTCPSQSSTRDLRTF